MLFAHDTELALISASDLVNTSRNGLELLPDAQSYYDFLVEHEFSELHPISAHELRAARVLRTRLRAVWEADDVDEVAGIVNGLLVEARALPVLSNHDGWDWHLHLTAADSPLHHRIAAESAMGFVDLVRSHEYARLKQCAADDCDAVLVDLSRNRSKQYCDTGNCANRHHVAAYRARQRG